MFIGTPPATAPTPDLASEMLSSTGQIPVVRTSNPAPHGWTTHVVRVGENLTVIAARHRTTVGVLVARNHLADPDVIHAGQRLSVPSTAARTGKATRPTKPAPRHTGARSTRRLTYVVRPGDTPWLVALRHHVSLASLLKANRLTPRTIIHVGDVLTIRTVSTPAPRKKAPAHRPARRPAAVPRTFLGVTYPLKVARSAARNRAWLAAHAVPSRAQTRALIIAAARRHGVDPRLALAVGWQESGWNQRAVSPANAIGVMQVIPSSGEWASALVGRRLNLLRPQDNVTAGVVILRALTRSAHTEAEAIAGYYQGLGSVQSRGMYSDTKRYVRNILAIKARM